MLFQFIGKLGHTFKEEPSFLNKEALFQLNQSNILVQNFQGLPYISLE
jgi:hypothetical protein